MGMDYGPWVRHDWCPRCARRTEQTRWHLGGAPAQEAERVKCNECAQEHSRAG